MRQWELGPWTHTSLTFVQSHLSKLAHTLVEQKHLIALLLEQRVQVTLHNDRLPLVGCIFPSPVVQHMHRQTRQTE